MLLWAGFVSILIGLLALTIDRQLAHFIYDHVNAKAHKALDSITHYAKAGHWLAAAILALIVAAVLRHYDVLPAESTQLINYSLAFIASRPWAALSCTSSSWCWDAAVRATTWRWGFMAFGRWPSIWIITASPAVML